MMSSGITATPPQPIVCCQPTKGKLATEGGAARRADQTGSPVPFTPIRSRTTPSVTSAATPRLTMRAQDVAGGVARAAQPSLFVQTQAAISELQLFTAL